MTKKKKRIVQSPKVARQQANGFNPLLPNVPQRERLAKILI